VGNPHADRGQIIDRRKGRSLLVQMPVKHWNQDNTPANAGFRSSNYRRYRPLCKILFQCCKTPQGAAFPNISPFIHA